MDLAREEGAKCSQMKENANVVKWHHACEPGINVAMDQRPP